MGCTMSCRAHSGGQRLSKLSREDMFEESKHLSSDADGAIDSADREVLRLKRLKLPGWCPPSQGPARPRRRAKGANARCAFERRWLSRLPKC